MPDTAKKRASPTIAQNKMSKNSSNTEDFQEANTVNEETLEPENIFIEDEIKQEIKPVEVITDIMNSEPVLASHFVETYQGECDEQGFYHGKGVITFYGGMVYSGSLQRGQMHGHGTYQWSNGIKYTGEFHLTRITGQGIYTWSDGSTYEGDVVNGLRHGYGSFRSADKNKSYTGEWNESKRHGKGILYYDATGTSYYDGDWVDGKKCGFGIRRFSNGNMYEGNWSNDTRNGKGTMYWYNLGQEYTGQWLNGIQNGHGENTWYLKRVTKSQYPLRNHYIGDFIDGERSGYGIFYYANSAIYEGCWRENMKHGHGTFKFKNGATFRGQFKNDRMVEFPNLILSGMATPDIAKNNIPINNTNARPVSTLQHSVIIENSTDAFLDVDIDNILDELQCNVDNRNEEMNNIVLIFLRHATNIKYIYKFYSGLGLEASIDNTFVMNKLQLWRLMIDYGFHRYDYSIMEIESYLNENNNMASCFKKVFFRDFLSYLIRIAYYLFHEEYVDEIFVISKCFEKFIYEMFATTAENIKVGGHIYKEVERFKEVANYMEECLQIYFYFCKVFAPKSSEMLLNGNYKALTLKDILQVFKQFGLVDEDFTGKRLVQIITEENKDEEGYFNLDKPASPLEFLEVVFSAPTYFITSVIVSKHSSKLSKVLPVFQLSPSKSIHDEEYKDQELTSDMQIQLSKSTETTVEVNKAVVEESSEVIEQSPTKNTQQQQTQKAATHKITRRKTEQKKLEKDTTSLLNASKSKEKGLSKMEKKRSSLKHEEIKQKSPSNKKETSNESIMTKLLSSDQSNVTAAEQINETQSSAMTENKTQPPEDVMKEKSEATTVHLSNITTTTTTAHVLSKETNKEIDDDYELWLLKLNLFFNHYFFPVFKKRKEIDSLL